MFTHNRSLFVFLSPFILGLLLSGCGQGDQSAPPAPTARPVKTVTVVPTMSRLERTYSAVVLAHQEVDLSFRVSGRIVELPIRSGFSVKKGDVIAQLDTRDFKAQVSVLEAQVEQADAQMQELTKGARSEDIASAQADVAASQAKLDEAVAQAGRTKELFTKGYATKTTLDQDVTAQRVAQADLKAKQQALIKGRAGARKEDVDAQQAVISGLKAQLESANDALSDATLLAPFDGIIALREADNFTNVQKDATVAVLQNISTLDLTFDVPGPDVASLAEIQNLDLSVTLDSISGKKFVAKHTEFSTQADAATQTYRGRVTINNLDGEVVLPGMTGNVTVTEKKDGAEVFKIPLSAIAIQADGKPFVWTVSSSDNKVTRHAIVTKEAEDNDIIVSEGLAKGDVVVTAGLSALQENMIVKPVTKIGE